jgi:serine/threonine protein kinase/tetratricopeptide (TPR) repeat protein
MEERWRAGERPLTEDCLASHPELAACPAAAMELLYEELCLRREHGVSVSADELLRRFPQWPDAVRLLVDCHELFEERAPPVEFPEAGERLGEFTLLAELGRGSQGRVFLASQPALAGRLVVLKLVPDAGQEHLTLARLQHTHIVPLYAVAADPPRQLRVLCLPWFGGASLGELLRLVAGVPAPARHGRHLFEVLAAAQGGLPVPPPAGGRAPERLRSESWTRAICWIGIGLARALHHAHERGLVHLDLKPSNILIAADGTPMLLDFHLARAAIPAGAAAPPWLGGTPAYMAPEQRQALDAVRLGKPVPAAVDARADVYGLGTVLYEALGGPLPVPGRHPERLLRRYIPAVSRGLADLLGRSLAPEPARRYATAGDFAADLERHLADLPLRGVANRSPAERWAKWRRRRPLALPLLLVLLAAAVAGGVSLWYLQNQERKARGAMEEGRSHLAARRYGEAAGALRRAVALAEDLPWRSAFLPELRELSAEAERVEAAGQLHEFVELVREQHAGDPLTKEAAAALEEASRPFWENRERITRLLAPLTDPDLARQVRIDLLDLAIFRAGLLARRGGAAAARQGLDVLDRAEALYGPGCVLCREREALAAAAGLDAVAREARRQAEALPPSTAWEHLALGRALLRAGRPAEALPWFDRALQLQPGNLHAQFGKGRCARLLGRPHDALAAFHACVALAPNSARCRYNRGLAYADLGRADEALADYDRALALDPKLAPASLNRAVLLHQQGRHAEALADLDRAGANGADPAAVHYNRALVQLARGDRAAAAADLREALRHDPGHRDALALRDRLRRGEESSGKR